MASQLRSRLQFVVPLLWLALLGCARGPALPISGPRQARDEQKPGTFADKTAESGIQFTYRNGQEANHFSILESLGGGVGLLDFDKDGLLDIFVLGGGFYDGPDKKEIKGHACRLYRNLGNWKFEDVTDNVGLNSPLIYSHGCAVADYDNDGFPDLLVTGWGRLILYHNEPDGKGGRHFRDVTKAAGLDNTLWSSSAAWGDLDGDGYPELYVCHYTDWSWQNNPACKDYSGGQQPDVCPPKSFTALPHVLYKNNRNGTFTDISKDAGLRVPRTDTEFDRLKFLAPESVQHLREAHARREYGKGLGVVIVDVNDDHKPDIYVANDTVDNFLYLNKGGARFEEVALLSAVARDDNGSPNGSMGVDAADYDGTARFSIFVTNYQHEAHALYRNIGDRGFVYASKSAGIAAIGLIYVGFGTGFIDFDRDGAEDLFIANGHVVRHPPPPGTLEQRALLLRNLRRPGDKPSQVRFADVSKDAGPFFQSRHIGRGVAFGDLDNDGKVDIVVSHLNEPVAVLRNEVDNGNHWLGVELVGKLYKDSVGAKLTLEVGGQKLLRTIKGGSSYLSAHDLRIVFGLGSSDKAGTLTVRWPSGLEQSWDGLEIDRYHRLVEGAR